MGIQVGDKAVCDDGDHLGLGLGIYHYCDEGEIDGGWKVRDGRFGTTRHYRSSNELPKLRVRAQEGLSLGSEARKPKPEVR